MYSSVQQEVFWVSRSTTANNKSYVKTLWGVAGVDCDKQHAHGGKQVRVFIMVYPETHFYCCPRPKCNIDADLCFSKCMINRKNGHRWMTEPFYSRAAMTFKPLGQGDGVGGGWRSEWLFCKSASPVWTYKKWRSFLAATQKPQNKEDASPQTSLEAKSIPKNQNPKQTVYVNMINKRCCETNVK